MADPVNDENAPTNPSNTQGEVQGPANRTSPAPPKADQVDSATGDGSDFYNTPLTGGTPLHPTTLASAEHGTPSLPGTPQKMHPPIPGLNLCNAPGNDIASPPADKPLDVETGGNSLPQVMTATDTSPTDDSQNNSSSAVKKEVGTDDSTTDSTQVTTVPPTVNGTERKEQGTSDGSGTVDQALLIAHGAALDVEPTASTSVPITEGQYEEDGEPEWEIDSSPYESSSSDSTSDDDDDEEDEDYELLDPEEQARLLMEGASDDEGEGKGGKKHVRTANEMEEEVLPIPDIIVTDDTKVEMLGNVETIVDNIVLIKANISGEYQVLETGSVLCLANLKVIGVVSETLGKVEQPLYTVRFKSAAEIKEMGIEKGAPIFYLVDHSTFVFTQPLKGLKGSDASNIHDEEVGEDEVEFSDDEAEAEYRRQQKAKRQQQKEARGGVTAGRKGRGGAQPPSGLRNTELNYDDVEMEDGYTPLSRPKNLHEMMGGQQAPVEQPWPRADKSFRGSRARDRGGYNRGGRASRGKGSGYQRHSQDHIETSNSNSLSASQGADQQPQQPQQQQPGPYGQFPQQYNLFQALQQMPHGNAYPSPLLMQYPSQPFVFGQPHQQQPFQFPPPGSHINPAFFTNLQLQAQQAQPQSQQVQSTAQLPRSENQNAADTFAAAQAQLDLLRRLSKGHTST
ncbi:hypothetical protein VTO42DRAFT_5833 [Malbranchea cinnamomea]